MWILVAQLLAFASGECVNYPITSTSPPTWRCDFTILITNKGSINPTLNSTSGTWYYSATTSRQLFTWNIAKYIPVCGSNTNYGCNLYTNDTKLYVKINSPTPSCCYCCNSTTGCGMQAQDYFTTFTKNTVLSTPTINQWDKTSIGEYFWDYALGERPPYKYQVRDTTYYYGSILSISPNPTMLTLPSICTQNVKCPHAACASVRSVRKNSDSETQDQGVRTTDL